MIQSAKLMTILLVAMVLTHCAQHTTTVTFDKPFTEEKRYQQPVHAYLQSAQHEDESTANYAKLQAAGRALDDGMPGFAGQLLNDIHYSRLDSDQQHEYHLLRAQHSVVRNQPKEAFRHLSKISPNLLQTQLQNFYHELRAKALYQSNDMISYAETLLTLDKLKHRTNHSKHKIMHALSKVDEKSLSRYIQNHPNQPLASLATLAVALKKPHLSDDVLRETLSQVPVPLVNTSAIQQPSAAMPKRIALLLPLSGPLQGPGQAIRDGFMDAYYKTKTKHYEINVFDTYAEPLEAILQKVRYNQINFVVGPLDKSKVQQYIHANLNIPSLLLNQSPAPLPYHMYAYGIDPKDEAIQVAEKAYDKGYRRALIIRPTGGWGEQISQSFQARFSDHGGTIVENISYTHTKNIGAQIKRALEIPESEQRTKSLQSLLKHKLHTYPRRRQDADMIFLIALPSDARQIRPMLRYYFAGDLPVMATSAVYDGVPSPRRDRDLNGIIFCDMPGLIYHPEQFAHLHTPWPESLNSHSRLSALGKDSFLIVDKWSWLQALANLGLLGDTGHLYLTNQTVKRELEWAKFRNGTVTPYRG